jgi:hypothetical protein
MACVLRRVVFLGLLFISQGIFAQFACRGQGGDIIRCDRPGQHAIRCCSQCAILGDCINCCRALTSGSVRERCNAFCDSTHPGQYYCTDPVTGRGITCFGGSGANGCCIRCGFADCVFCCSSLSLDPRSCILGCTPVTTENVLWWLDLITADWEVD